MLYDTTRTARRLVAQSLLCAVFLAAPAAAQWTNTGGGDHGGADWTISANTVIAGTHTNVGTFTINGGVTATVQAYNGTAFGRLHVAANTINIAGTLSADGAGFPQSQGPGGVSASPGGSGGHGSGAGGGGHGGAGGNGGNASSYTGSPGGAPYDPDATALGSGGGVGNGGNSPYPHSMGGGAISLTGNTVTLNNVTANGASGGVVSNGNGCGNEYVGGAGGGAGGSILVNAGALTVNGSLTANGGAGQPGQFNYTCGQGGGGGGGGGGRIRISYASKNTFTATANGGAGAAGGTPGGGGAGAAGAAGTVALAASAYTPVLVDVSAWSRTLRITLGGTGTALTDHQVRITLNKEPEMSADYRDLRFVSASSLRFAHFVESQSPTQAVVWVRVPSIPASGTSDLFVKFGNAAAANVSSGAETFLFFDDFNAASLDTAKWTLVANGGNQTISQSGGLLNVTPTYNQITSVAKFGEGTTLETWAKTSATGSSYTSLGFATDPPTYMGPMQKWMDPSQTYFYYTGFYGTDSIATGASYTGTFRRFTVRRKGGGAADLSVDGSVVAQAASGAPTGLLGVGAEVYENSTQIDWMLVRKYAATEPTVSIAPVMTAPTAVVIDEISTTEITASAYAPTPAFPSLQSGQSGTAIAKDGAYAPYHSPGNVWTTKASIPNGRQSPGIVAVDGKVYVLGGDDPGGTRTLNERYDPATNTWASMAAMPTGRNQLAIGVINGRIYVTGGWGGDYQTATEEYNPATNAWTTKAPLPGIRAHLASAVYNGRLYVLGGYNGSPVATNQYFDPAANAWTTVASLPTARYGAAAAEYGGKIYVVGGSDGGKRLDRYDPVANTWTQLADMPTSRSFHAVVVVGGKLLVFGGDPGGVTAQTVEEYDPAVNAWATRASMPSSRNRFRAAAVRGKVYVIGGEPTVAINEEYDPGVSTTFTGLTPGTLYSFKAKARDAAGLETAESPVATATTLTPPPNTWNGVAGDSQWNTAGNWSLGRVPLAADNAVISGNVTVTASGSPISFSTLALGGSGATTLVLQTTLASGGATTVGSGGTLESRTASQLTMASLTVNNGGKLTHTAIGSSNTVLYLLNLNIGGALTLNTGSTVDLTGKGHGGASGPSQNGYGPGGGKGAGSSDSGGGGYGGNGGGCAYNAASCAGGTAYGSASDPSQPGSGGGGGYNNGASGGPLCATAGGGAFLATAGSAVLNGAITANGNQKTQSCAGAAGSGGAIKVAAATLSGTGALNARGGNSSTDNNQGGSGGGRIALSATGTNSFSGSCSAAQGSIPGGANAGQAGTTLCTPPAAPGSPSISLVGHSGLTLNFTAGAGATSYEAQLALDAGFTSGLVTLTGTALYGSFTGLAPSTLYHARVRSIGAGASAYTAAVSATTLAAPPALTAIALSPASAALSPGLTQRFLAVGTYAGGGTASLSGADNGTSRTNLPTAAKWGGGAALNGLLYSVGGDSGSGPIGNLQAYDPAANAWAQRAPLPTPRNRVSSVVLDGKLYAIGGDLINGCCSSTALVDAYDPATNAWTSRAPMAGGARDWAAAAAVGGKIYAFGGNNGSSDLTRVEAYDPTTNSWSTKLPMPRARRQHMVAAIGTKVYVFGWAAETDVYDTVANSWGSAASAPMILTDAGVVVHNGRIYVLNGMVGSSRVDLQACKLEYSIVSPK